MEKKQIKMSVFVSLFTVLIVVGSYISVPIGIVPIVLQNMFVLLAGLLLGARYAAASVALFLLLGSLGLPVFAGGKGGFAHIIGPTGGFLISYLIAAFVVGLISHIKKEGSIFIDIAAVLAGMLIIYLIGFSWLKFSTGMDWLKVLLMIPTYLVGGVIKSAACVLLSAMLRPLLKQLIEK